MPVATARCPAWTRGTTSVSHDQVTSGANRVHPGIPANHQHAESYESGGEFMAVGTAAFLTAMRQPLQLMVTYKVTRKQVCSPAGRSRPGSPVWSTWRTPCAGLARTRSSDEEFCKALSIKPGGKGGARRSTTASSSRRRCVAVLQSSRGRRRSRSRGDERGRRNSSCGEERGRGR